MFTLSEKDIDSIRSLQSFVSSYQVKPNDTDTERNFNAYPSDYSKVQYLRELRLREQALSNVAFYAWSFMPKDELENLLRLRRRVISKLQRNTAITFCVFMGSKVSSVARWFGLHRSRVIQIMNTTCRYFNREVFARLCDSFVFVDKQLDYYVYAGGRYLSLKALRRYKDEFLGSMPVEYHTLA